MTSLDALYNAAYDNIRNDVKAWEAQKHFLQVVANLRNTDIDILYENKMLFIPNDQYLVHFAGKEIMHPSYGCYLNNNTCYWNNQLMIPIENFVGEIKGFAAFNPFNYAEAKSTNDKSITYYSYSMKDVFPKGKFLFCPGNSYELALDDGYLFLVDGVFDAASIRHVGFNAAAMMGSMPTQYIIMQLRFIKRVILVADNDEAGYKLYSELRRKLHNVELLKQGSAKDADEVLKSAERDQFIETLKRVAEDSGLLGMSSF